MSERLFKAIVDEALGALKPSEVDVDDLARTINALEKRLVARAVVVLLRSLWRLRSVEAKNDYLVRKLNHYRDAYRELQEQLGEPSDPDFVFDNHKPEVLKGWWLSSDARLVAGGLEHCVPYTELESD